MQKIAGEQVSKFRACSSLKSGNFYTFVFRRFTAWNTATDSKLGNKTDESANSESKYWFITSSGNSNKSTGTYEIRQTKSQGCADQGAAEMAKSLQEVFN